MTTRYPDSMRPRAPSSHRYDPAGVGEASSNAEPPEQMVELLTVTAGGAMIVTVNAAVVAHNPAVGVNV